MRILHLSLASPFLPYLVSGCDPNACKIGSSAGIAAVCEAGTAALGVVSGGVCMVTGIITLGLSCVAALGATVAVGVGCAVGTSAAENGG